MFRFRYWLLMATAAVGFVLCAGVPATTPTANTALAGHATYQYRYYYVYYRTCPHDAWHYYGATVYPAQATAAVVGLRQRGYQAFAR